ncbi:beta-phosphoglucomutase [Lachnospiraceae bacterium C7]|nr:beta-phosphoglucomutase [Lachnospiraceae bacterium C7]
MVRSSKKNWIFDLDGVIVFTDKFHYLAWKKMAKTIGIDLDEKTNNRLRGVSRADSLEIILEQYKGEPLSQKKKNELMEEKNNLYREYLNEMTPNDVSDDVKKTLRVLRERGDKLAIGSSSKNARLILEKVGLTDAFDEIADGTNIKKGKPDPEVFLKAAEFLHKAPEKCIAVDDAFSGIDAAKNANMKAIGIGDSARYEKADYKINKFSDLLAI